MPGRQPSVLSTPDALRADVASQGGDATMAPQGLTFGRLVDGGKVGMFLAEYRKVAQKAATAYYNIPHGLGVIPAFAILVAIENPNQPSTNICASASDYHKWTATEVRVRVDVIMGATTDTAMWFLIGGQR